MQEFKTKGFSGVKTCHILGLKAFWSGISKHANMAVIIGIKQTRLTSCLDYMEYNVALPALTYRHCYHHCTVVVFSAKKINGYIYLRDNAQNWQKFKLGKTTILRQHAATIKNNSPSKIIWTYYLSVACDCHCQIILGNIYLHFAAQHMTVVL